MRRPPPPPSRCSERVTPGALASALNYRVEAHASLGSTNDRAMDAALAGDPGKLWIVAGEQTGGRGRLGRVWSSPPGNLYSSLLLIDPAPIAVAAQIGFVAALALHDAVTRLAPALAPLLRLKWPNDLLLDGAKLSGILVESANLANGRLAVVTGMGVNLAHHPQGTPYPVTSLAAQGITVSPETMLKLLSDAFARRLESWQAEGFAAIRRDWLAAAAGLGGPIRVRTGREDYDAIFSDLDEHGRLVASTPTGQRIVQAGDVFLLDRPGMTPADGNQDL